MQEVRLIDANALKQHYNVPDAEGVFSYCDTIMRVIDEQPTIDAEPVLHGRWDNNGTGSRIYPYLCTECKESCDYPFPYCPICGARMDGGADNG